MVAKALDVLEADQEKGYFLFVEGGRIDHAHHDAQAERALDETVEFGKAIELARKRTQLENTLIVVTSDHSHTMSIAGYSSRGNDILGINNSQNGDDELPYSTLSYANGPGHVMNMNKHGRKHLRANEMHRQDKVGVSLGFPTKSVAQLTNTQLLISFADVRVPIDGAARLDDAWRRRCGRVRQRPLGASVHRCFRAEHDTARDGLRGVHRQGTEVVRMSARPERVVDVVVYVMCSREKCAK